MKFCYLMKKKFCCLMTKNSLCFRRSTSKRSSMHEMLKFKYTICATLLRRTVYLGFNIFVISFQVMKRIKPGMKEYQLERYDIVSKGKRAINSRLCA